MSFDFFFPFYFNFKSLRPHGNGGVVKAKFRRNLPPKSFGAGVRIVSGINFSKIYKIEDFFPIIQTYIFYQKKKIDAIPVSNLRNQNWSYIYYGQLNNNKNKQNFLFRDSWNGWNRWINGIY